MSVDFLADQRSHQQIRTLTDGAPEHDQSEHDQSEHDRPGEDLGAKEERPGEEQAGDGPADAATSAGRRLRRDRSRERRPRQVDRHAVLQVLERRDLFEGFDDDERRIASILLTSDEDTASLVVASLSGRPGLTEAVTDITELRGLEGLEAMVHAVELWESDPARPRAIWNLLSRIGEVPESSRMHPSVAKAGAQIVRHAHDIDTGRWASVTHMADLLA